MIIRYIFALVTMSLASFAFAQETELPTTDSSAVTIQVAEQVSEGFLDSGNTAWMLTATALVLFMTLPGWHFSMAD